MLAGPSTALAANRNVTIAGSQFSPGRTITIAGDTVRWENRDFTPHNVTHDLFSSGSLSRLETFEHDFHAAGVFDYHCTIHFGMRGSVEVYDVYLAPPPGSILFGKAVVLRGLARQASEVIVQRVADGSTIGTATAGSEGSFAVSLAGSGPSFQVRAVEGAYVSRAVKILIRPKLTITARRVGSRHLVTVTATPRQAGAKVAIERSTGLGWKRLARSSLNGASKASLRISVTGTARIRARITRAVGGYAPGLSGTIRVRG